MYQNDTLNYRILKPLDYDQNQQYPVHLFLHGAGERGSDNNSQLKYVDHLFLKKENRDLKDAVEILKKAMSIISSQ